MNVSLFKEVLFKFPYWNCVFIQSVRPNASYSYLYGGLQPTMKKHNYFI